MLSKIIVETALTQLGIEEKPKGSNAGQEVETYLKSVGLGKGFPWCMSFVYWVVKTSCVKTSHPNLLIKTGGVLKQWNESQKLRVENPEPGDVFIMDYGKGKGHAGLVIEVLPNGTVNTVEGNTNIDGSREGYAVCKHNRKISKMKGFLRPGL